MKPTWEILPQKKETIGSSQELLDQLFINRNLDTEEKINKFLNPRLEDYQDDLNIPGVEDAKKRILEAVKKEELIIIYGDFDVDGVCATAILYHTLSSLGAKVLPYIPHREKEGYGLSCEGLQKAFDKGASLIITVDNGIVALKAADFANSLGLDLIITDHHTSLEKKPQALSIIHSTNLSGGGVAWVLAKSLLAEDDALELLDLVAIATVSDLIPLRGVNRSLVKLGIEKLNNTKRVGLLALFMEAGIERQEINTYHIGYIIGPRLNAMGRMEHALDSLRLLCTKDANRAHELAKILSKTNNLRKEKTLEAYVCARELCQIKNEDNQKIIVLSSKEWGAGIIGLVAGKLTEEFGIPSIIISEGELFSKGSARTVNGVNIVETIRKCQDLLVDVGGHEKAAGFTVETSKIALFKAKLEEIIASEKIEMVSKVKAEGIIDLKKISLLWVNQLTKFEPFGIGNQKPVFVSFKELVESARTVGEGKHLKLKVEGIDAIAFGMGNLIQTVKDGQPVDLAFYLDIDKFNGQEKVQLKIVDMKLAV